MNKVFVTLLLFIFLTGCSREPPIIIQEATDTISENSIEIEEEYTDEEQIQFLEFTLSDQIISLNINKIPILYNFLENHNDKDQAIQEMQLIQILKDKFDSIFLLNFACQESACSYVLINTKTESSQLLADQAQIVKIKPSHEESYLLIQFERQLLNKNWLTNKLVIFDLEKWEEVILTEDDHNMTSLHSFRWPILNVEWLSDDELEITLPDIDFPTTTTLADWYESEDKLEKTVITPIN